VDRADDVFFTDGSRIYEVDHATGQILVVAGTGVNGYSGDGGPATEADLSLPGGIALAPNGDLYVVDELRIRKISAATGIITTVAGTGQVGDTGNGGPAVRADLDLVTGPAGTLGLDGPIAVGPNGDLYIADGGNDEVRRVSAATGIITTVAGDGVAGSSGDGGPATKAEICQPEGIVVDRSDDLFITTACDAIRQVSARNGLISTVFRVHQAPALAGEGTPYRPVGLGLAADGRLLVIGFSSRRILELAPTSDTVVLAAGTGYQTVPTAGATAGDGGPASAATFGLIDAVTMDAQGDIYVADFFNNAIREIDPRTGLITLLAGQIPQSPAAGHCC
jgi:sugar lactone lactonase YvrE